jgi:predicted DNA-binding ribbon-helix-helix protein
MSVTPSGLVRRSVTLAGHRTSVALEPIFWEELAAIAAARGTSLATVIGEIDAARPGNLSSAIRVYVVECLRGRISSRESI